MKRIVVIVTMVVTAWGVPVPPARAASGTEITLLGTQFAPQWTQVSAAGGGLVWVNKEPANYPVVIGNHNIVPDNIGAAAVPGSKPFPASSPLLKPGDSWSCGAADGGLVCPGIEGRPVTVLAGRYTYMCGIHPNQMRGILDLTS